MTSWAGFWIGLGIFVLGMGIHDGLVEAAAIWVKKRSSE
jgi:hypothetical protein